MEFEPGVFLFLKLLLQVKYIYYNYIIRRDKNFNYCYKFRLLLRDKNRWN